MDIVKLCEVIAETKRFLRKAEAAYERLEKEEGYLPKSKETAAARRASMDLTRALADLRRY